MAARAQPPGITAVPIWGDDGGGGPTPPSDLTDHFEATIIVGNVPNGDPAVAQAAPFRYIPDDGDGVGLATAIGEAASSGLPTRIRIRPGTYDFGAGGVSLPRTVPSFCSLEGSGEGVTVLVGSANARAVLAQDVSSLTRFFTIELPSAGGNPSGERVVRLAESAVAERVTIIVGDGSGAQEDDSLRACFDHQGLHSRVLDCLAIVNDPMTDPTQSPQIAYAGIGPRTSGPAVGDTLTRLRGRGLGELVFVGALVSSFALDLQGVCAAAGTINGTQGQGRIQATVQVGAAGRAGSLQIAGQVHLFDLSIYDGDGSSIDGYIDCTSARSVFRVALEGAGVSGVITDSGESNTWTGSLDANAATVFAVDGEAIALDSMRITAPASGDIVFGATSLNCSAIGCRISGATDDTAGGTGNNRALNLEGV